jgi:hypothetical protein
VTPTLARLGLAAVLGIAALEWIASAWAYRDRLDDEDWAAVADGRENGGPPLLVANGWLEPLARSRLPDAARQGAVARPDLRGVSTFDVLGLDGAAWSDDLQDDLEDLPVPTVVASRDFGDLTVTTYAFDQPAPVTADLQTVALRVETPGGICRGRGPWTCKEGSVGWRVVEVDYRPRRCLVADLADGTTVRVRMADAPVGTVLRGHVGFSDFNGRLRSDAPAELSIELAGAPVARFVVTDEEGWRPFAVASGRGRADVTIELRTAMRGRWGRDAYEAGAPRPVCIELRAFEEAAP